MRIALGSGGFRGEERLAFIQNAAREHFAGVPRIVFIPHALDDHDAYTSMMIEKELNGGRPLVGLHTLGDPAAAMEEAEAVWVGGGNSFRLVKALHEMGIIDIVRRRVLAGEMRYMGASAGANVACPTMQTTNDMPIVYPPSFDAFGIVPFQINAHYHPGQVSYQREEGGPYLSHFGESRDLRIKEFHEVNDAPVLGLYEGAMLFIEGERGNQAAMRLEGAPCRVFVKGADAYEVEPGADVSSFI